MMLHKAIGTGKNLCVEPRLKLLTFHRLWFNSNGTIDCALTSFKES